MGKRSEKDSGDDDSLALATQYYYYYIWKSRLDWTNHAIPIRTIDPNSGFFIEAYIQSPPNITDITTQKVEVDICFLTTYRFRTIEVLLTNIFPTKRTLKYLDPNTSSLVDTIPGFKEIDSDTFSKFSTKLFPIELKYLDDIFDYYRMSFTHPELESLLNNTFSEEILSKKYICTGKRQCIITSKMLDTYISSNVKTDIEKQIVDEPIIEKKEEEIPLTLIEKEDTVKVCNSLKQLTELYKNCTLCNLGEDRNVRKISDTITYPRLGKINIDKIETIPKDIVCFIGEAPGLQEEQNNITFYPKAPAGEILYKVINASNFDYDKCYFTNSVLCRPNSDSSEKQNVKPNKQQINACNTRLKNELAIIKPKIVVLLGKTAYTAFYGKEPKDVIGSLGWLNEEKTIYFCFHPSYVSRSISFAIDSSDITKIKNNYLGHFNQINNRFKELIQ